MSNAVSVFLPLCDAHSVFLLEKLCRHIFNHLIHFLLSAIMTVSGFEPVTSLSRGIHSYHWTTIKGFYLKHPSRLKIVKHLKCILTKNSFYEQNF